MGCVVTPIVGRPRPLSRHRHAQTTGTCLYTLICEEPLIRLGGQELAQEVAMGAVQFNSVETGLDRTACPLHVVVDLPLDLMTFDLPAGRFRRRW